MEIVRVCEEEAMIEYAILKDSLMAVKIYKKMRKLVKILAQVRRYEDLYFIIKKLKPSKDFILLGMVFNDPVFKINVLMEFAEIEEEDEIEILDESNFEG